jgi:hypothetical protein
MSMKDFVVITKIGMLIFLNPKFEILIYLNLTLLLLKLFFKIGDGAYSTVYKVKRLSD